MQPAVYIVCDKRHGTLYTGVTSDLARRAWEHRIGAVTGFTRRYGLKLLAWYEVHETMEDAIVREKRIKAWKRGWKVRLIERMNPTWRDLYEDLNR
jgi:putative endonuclease